MTEDSITNLKLNLRNTVVLRIEVFEVSENRFFDGTTKSLDLMETVSKKDLDNFIKCDLTQADLISSISYCKTANVKHVFIR